MISQIYKLFSERHECNRKAQGPSKVFKKKLLQYRFKKSAKSNMTRQKKLTMSSKNCCDKLGKMDLEDSTIKNMCSDFAALMEAAKQCEVEISVY